MDALDGNGARHRRRRAADHRCPIAWPALAALSGRRDDAGRLRFPARSRRSGMDDAARIGVLARLSGLGSATARPAHPQRPRAARPGYDRRGGRGVPVRQFRRCFRCRRAAAPWRVGRHGNDGHGNGFSLARTRAGGSPASGDGTGPGRRRAARGNCYSGSGVRTTLPRFPAGCTPSPVFSFGYRDGDRRAPGADRRRDGDPVRCATDPPGLAGRSCRPARPPRRAERLRLELA